MGNKKLKIITSCVGLIALSPLATSCSSNKQEEEEKQKEQEKLANIEILSDINDIKLELHETYVSNPIEIKCYTESKKEIQAKTSLFLYPLDKNNVDIKIEDNRICIGNQKQPGIYKYQLVAKSEDSSIKSESKEFSVEVFDEVQPDSIEIIGEESITIKYHTSKMVDYQLTAKAHGEVIEHFDPRCICDVQVGFATTGKYSDIYGNPIFNIEQNDKTLSLNLSKNIDKSYEGNYSISIDATLLSNPEVKTRRVIDVTLTYDCEYVDTNRNFIYSREVVEDEWSLKSIPSGELMIDSGAIIEQINGVNVNSIANNLCSNSGIKTFVLLQLKSNIKYIGSYAFYKQEALNTLVIENVEGIGESAFEACTLAAIDGNIDQKYKYVCDNAFKNCTEFEPKNLPNIVYLGESCLSGTRISDLTLGENLKVIGANAFSACPNLKDIRIKATVPPYLMGDILGEVPPSGFKIHVPSSALDSYRNADIWASYSQYLVGDITM